MFDSRMGGGGGGLIIAICWRQGQLVDLVINNVLFLFCVSLSRFNCFVCEGVFGNSWPKP